MKKQAEDWIVLADKDLYVCEIILKDEYALTNIVAFHCQQAIEKYLKAFLIEKGSFLIKTHDLIRLNEMVNEIKNMGLDENKLMEINEVYVESRYPGELGLMPDGMPSNEQAREFIDFAKEVMTIIKNELQAENNIKTKTNN